MALVIALAGGVGSGGVEASPPPRPLAMHSLSTDGLAPSEGPGGGPGGSGNGGSPAPAPKKSSPSSGGSGSGSGSGGPGPAKKPQSHPAHDAAPSGSSPKKKPDSTSAPTGTSQPKKPDAAPPSAPGGGPAKKPDPAPAPAAPPVGAAPPGRSAAASGNPTDLLGTLAPRPGLDKNGKADPFAPLGATPWSRGINQAAMDAGIPGASGIPSKLSPQQMAVATLVDPAYQAHQVLADPQASAQATRNRWDALKNGDLGKVGSAYWNDPGTTFAQDVHTLLTHGNSATAQVMRALDRTPLGYAVPYAAAATGNFIGGAAHTAVNEAKRWGPAMVANTVLPGGALLARAAGIDVFSQAKSDYKRDPVGTVVEDGTSALAIASGGAGAAARAGAVAREGTVAGAGETAASGVVRSQAGRSPWSATKDFAQSGWNHVKNLVAGDTPRGAAPRPGPGTPHRDDVGKPDRYVPPAKPTDTGSGKTPSEPAPERPNGSISDQRDGNLFPKSSRPAGVPELRVEDKQFGKKIGKHAPDYNLNPADPAGRTWLRNHVDEAGNYPDEVRQGLYNPQGGGGADYLFYRKGSDVVVAKSDGEFVSIFKDGVDNQWFMRASPIK